MFVRTVEFIQVRVTAPETGAAVAYTTIGCGALAFCELNQVVMQAGIPEID
jgi:hypothetical protein